MHNLVFYWQFDRLTNCCHRFRTTALWLVGLLSLASCDPHPARQPEAAAGPKVASTAAPASGTAPAAASPPAPPAAPPTPVPAEAEKEPAPPAHQMLAGETARYHRYVGTLGTRPVVLELFLGMDEAGESRTNQLSGSYYDARRGGRTLFSSQDFHPHRRLHLVTYTDESVPEHWRTQQPLGPSLTGTVAAKGHRARHFALREDYRAAVPLVIGSAQMYGETEQLAQGDRGEKQAFTGSYRLRYVHLLGAAARRPALWRLLPSRPAQVRARLQQEFEEGEAASCNIDDYRFRLDLNDYGILSYSKDISDYMVGSPHPNDRFESFSCDLRTGRRITLASLLRPGRQSALRRLALRYMDGQYRLAIQDWNNSPEAPADYLQSVNLAESFGLTADGLLLNANIGPHVMGSTTITSPYAALRPLLRPRTPLNRVLVARGLRPVL
ncbi:MAG: hypothetical protein ACRYF0_08160 [Janthinobacterium lividum]